MYEWIDTWNGVLELNTRILKERHNLDYNKICQGKCDKDLRIDWILKYSRALIHEVAEFLEEKNEHKSKIELIDVLFFFIGVIQLSGIKFVEFEKWMLEKHMSYEDTWYRPALLTSAIKIEDNIAWKHWKTYNYITTDDFIKSLKLFINDWKELTLNKNMSDKNIFQAFEDKLKVNHDRQDSGYTTKKKDDDIHVRTE